MNRNADSYQQFQDLIFQEIEDAERLAAEHEEVPAQPLQANESGVSSSEQPKPRHMTVDGKIPIVDIKSPNKRQQIIEMLLRLTIRRQALACKEFFLVYSADLEESDLSATAEALNYFGLSEPSLGEQDGLPPIWMIIERVKSIANGR